MATREAILAIKVITDSTQAAAGLDKTAGSAGRMSSALDKATIPALAAGAAVLAIGKKSLDAASDMQQAEGAVEAVFGNQSDAVLKYADTAATAMGLSAAQYDKYAALVGGALQSAGMSVKGSVTESNKLIQTGADLAATYGGTTADAVEAINAAVARSEFDPLEKFNVSLNMTAVNAELAARGQDKLTGKQLAAAKSAIILEQIYGKSAKTAGQYAKEQDSAAGSAQTAAAQWENAAAALGTALLPAATAVATTLGKVGGWMQENRTAAQLLLGMIGGLAATVLILNAALKTAAVFQAAWNAVTGAAKGIALGTRIQLVAMTAAEYAQAAASKIAAIATTLFGAALKFAMGPIGLVIIGIGLLIAAVILLWRNSETFRRIVTAVWSAIKTGAKAVATFLKRVFSVVWRLLSIYVRTYAAVVRAVFNAIRAVVVRVVSIIKTVWSGAMNKARDLVQSLRDTARNAWDSIAATVRRVVSTIKSLWSGMISALKRAASGLGAILAKPFDVVKTAVEAVKRMIDNLIDAVGNLISKISGIHFPKIPGPIGDLLGRSAPAAAAPRVAARGYAPSPLGVGAPAVPMGLASTGGAGIVIQINGALDPEGVARQIKRILGGHDRRIGGQVR